MNRRHLLRLTGYGAGGAALAVAGFAGRGVLTARANDSAKITTPHWTYEGEEGPEFWGELDPSFASCSGGTHQSPIDVSGASGADLPDIAFDYGVISPLRIVNNGHTVQVNAPAGNSIVVNDKLFELKQFHFHTPSEHTVDGKAEEMELHLVHISADGEIAVVGVMLAEGAENAALMSVFQAMPVMAGPELEVKGSVDPNALLPASRATYRYSGSLTTPPCTEGVNWLLMTEAAQVSPAQVAAFRTIFAVDARPVQPRHDRALDLDTTA